MSAPLPRAELARLIVSQVCLHACMTGFRMAAPLMALQAGYGAAAVGMLLALFALAQVVLALPSGRLADRRGVRFPLRLAIAVATSGALLALAWPVFGVLCLTALTCGAATCLTMTAIQRYAGKLAQDVSQLKQVFSWLAIAPSISNFLGPFCAGLLIDAGGFRAAFLLLALLPLLAWIPSRQLTEIPAQHSEAPGSSGSAWNLLRLPDLRRLMIINWMLSSCWDVHTFLVPVLGHERGLSASAIGAILGGFALAATGIRLLMPWLSVHWRESTVIATAMVSTALLFAVYPLAQAAWAMGSLSVLLGVALGSVQPMIMSTLHQITPKHRHGEALGLRALAINGSSVVMPLLFGSAGVVVGAAGVFWAVGVLVGAGSRLALKLVAVPPPPPERV